MTRKNAARLGLLAVGTTLLCQVAAAQGGNKVAAEALFEEGRRLMEAKKQPEACPKFAESQRLDPSIGTLLNLASCYEVTGKIASAWATFKEAASAASTAGRTENLAVATKRADALAPRLTRLTITAPDGLEIKRDGAVVERATFGVPIPIDPGEHTVVATAPRKKPWSTKVTVDKEGARLTVEVPALEDAPADAATPPPPPTVSPAPPPTATQAPPPRASSTQKTVGLIVGGVGIVGLGVGTIFALSAKAKYNDSLPQCAPTDKNRCTELGTSQRDSARSAGNVATLAMGLGGAALVTGAVLFFTAPSQKEAQRDGARVEVVPTLGGALVRGTF